MRSPAAANEDQPGPIGFFHNKAGGEAAQSVSMRTPWITASRSGPRNPGHAGGGAVCGAAGASSASTTLRSVEGAGAAAEACGALTGIAGDSAAGDAARDGIDGT